MVLLLFISNPSMANKVVDIKPPAGFKRLTAADNSYIKFLRNLPLKGDQKIAMWDGTFLHEYTYSMHAVVDLPLLFNENLEQCADFSMRLWAEYLKSIDSLDKLSLYDFYGNKKPYSSSGKTFKEYLRWHMKYSNSYSIKLGAKNVNRLVDLQVGDMVVQNDSEVSIGHVSVIVDEAVNELGLKAYLVGYSYMPAQQFHIEKASDDYGIKGWFVEGGYYRYAKDRFGLFGEPVIKRF